MRKTQQIQQNSVFIDPESCGSSVGYYLYSSEYTPAKGGPTEYSISGTVVLADCSHKIDWSFVEGDVGKINAAIAMLIEFKIKFLEAEKAVKSKRK